MRFVFQFVIHSQLFTVFNWIWIISFHLNNNKICPNWDSNGRMLPGMGITMHNCIQIDGKLFDCVWPWYLIKWRAHSKCAFPECRWTSGAESWDWNSTTNRELEYFGIATSSERLHSWTMVKKNKLELKQSNCLVRNRFNRHLIYRHASHLMRFNVDHLIRQNE